MLKLDFEQAKIKEEERLKKRIEKNKKRISLALYLLLIAILLLIIVIAVMARVNKPEVIIDGTEVNLKHVNGKLSEYIKGLGNAYTIRYLGEFGSNNWNKDIKQATVEYTKEGVNEALYSKEISRYVVTKGDTVYSILHKFQLVVEAKKPVDFETKGYNLLSDFGQRYVADVKVKESGVEYIYQEYIYEDAKIRYYFVDDELRYIKVVDGENERKINVIIDRKTVKRELFDIPTNYTHQKA